MGRPPAPNFTTKRGVGQAASSAGPHRHEDRGVVRAGFLVVVGGLRRRAGHRFRCLLHPEQSVDGHEGEIERLADGAHRSQIVALVERIPGRQGAGDLSGDIERLDGSCSPFGGVNLRSPSFMRSMGRDLGSAGFLRWGRQARSADVVRDAARRGRRLSTRRTATATAAATAPTAAVSPRASARACTDTFLRSQPMRTTPNCSRPCL